MIKRTQNKVAESRFTLPATAAYAIAVWLLSGQLIPIVPFTSNQIIQGAWIQLICFIVSTYLMVELNNSNALIRIYSRMVSCSFIMLLCAGCFMFGSLSGAIVQLCLVTSCLMLFHCYQDRHSVGWTFYAFLFVGLSSLLFIQILFYVPFLWIMMFFQMTALSWRTFYASILGLFTPYWFIAPYFVFHADTSTPVSHLSELISFSTPFDYSQITFNQMLLFIFVVLLGVTGIVHYLRNQSADSIRIRMLYGCFIYLFIFTVIFLILQPQHFDILIRILIINTSPLIAHFISLTHTRITNVAFLIISTVAVLMTLFNLWMPSFSF